jgi:hypothetical protein
MGNLFSQLSDDIDNITNSPSGNSPSSNAPSAKYTVTPSVEDNKSPSESPAKKSISTPSSESPAEKCVQPNPSTTSSTSTTSSSPSSIPVKQVSRSNGDDENQFLDFINDIFNATTYTIIFWIITVYSIYLLGKSIFANKGVGNESSGVAKYSRTVDIILCFLLFSGIFSVYYKLDEKDKKNMMGYNIQWIQDYFNNPWELFNLIWFTIIFFALIYILKIPMTPDAKPVIVHFLERKIWIIYALFGIVFFFKYALGINIINLLFNNSIMNYFKDAKPYSSSPGEAPSVFDDIFDDVSKDIYDIESPSPDTNTSTKSSSSSPGSSSPGSSSPSSCVSDKQVFNVSNNLYTYEEAQKVCSAFDASLATYDQIEGSYKNGGEWCNYGWSEGQMAYFPTQKDTWNLLQENPCTKNVCGRPGINGGYIDNPYIHFGANCYGIKPKQPDGWKPTSYVQKLNIQKEEDPNIKLRDQASLNSFSQKDWSRY